MRARHHDERFFSILGNELRKKRTVYGVQKKKKKSRELALAFFFSFRLDGDGSLVLQE